MSQRPFSFSTRQLLVLLAASVLLTQNMAGLLSSAAAQEAPAGYKMVEKIVYDQTPVTVKRWVTETVNVSKTVTRFKTVTKTAKKERRETVMRPITETSERIEEYTVQIPVKRTKYRDQEIRETSYETVTEMQDKEVLVETTTFDTEMREQKTIVKKPVAETQYQTEKRITYRPALVTSEQLGLANLQVNQLVPVPGSSRPRAQWLSPGYYTDPSTGLTVYRRRGFHWVQQAAGYQVQTANLPVLSTQPVTEMTLVPEEVEVNTPTNVTKIVETIETRKVPVQVESTERKTVVRKVPVTVERPKVVVRTQKVPYEVTEYVDEVRQRKVPVEVTTMKPVEIVVPYEEQVTERVPYTETITVPETRKRLVEQEMIKNTPRKVWVRVPVDAAGNELGPGTPLQSRIETANSTNEKDVANSNSGGFAEPQSQTPPSVLGSESDSETTTAKKEPSILDKEDAKKPTEYHGRFEVNETANTARKTDETSLSSSEPLKAETNLRLIWRPDDTVPTSETGTTETPPVAGDEDLNLDLPPVTKPKRSVETLDLGKADLVEGATPAINDPNSATEEQGSSDSSTPDTETSTPDEETPSNESDEETEAGYIDSPSEEETAS